MNKLLHMVVKKTCFFIDDNADNLAIFTRALTHVSPDTICFVATNGEDALALMVEEEITPSCIFISEYVRGMSAAEFLVFAKHSELLKDVPVIIHGTDFPQDSIEELKDLGALALYTKPFTFLGVSNMLTIYFLPELSSISQN